MAFWILAAMRLVLDADVKLEAGMGLEGTGGSVLLAMHATVRQVR